METENLTPMITDNFKTPFKTLNGSARKVLCELNIANQEFKVINSAKKPFTKQIFNRMNSVPLQIIKRIYEVNDPQINMKQISEFRNIIGQLPDGTFEEIEHHIQIKKMEDIDDFSDICPVQDQPISNIEALMLYLPFGNNDGGAAIIPQDLNNIIEVDDIEHLQYDNSISEKYKMLPPVCLSENFFDM